MIASAMTARLASVEADCQKAPPASRAVSVRPTVPRNVTRTRFVTRSMANANAPPKAAASVQHVAMTPRVMKGSCVSLIRWFKVRSVPESAPVITTALRVHSVPSYQDQTIAYLSSFPARDSSFSGAVRLNRGPLLQCFVHCEHPPESPVPNQRRMDAQPKL